MKHACRVTWQGYLCLGTHIPKWGGFSIRLSAPPPLFFKVLWYASQPLLVMAAVVLTAGYGLLLDHPTDIPSTPPSRRGLISTFLLSNIRINHTEM